MIGSVWKEFRFEAAHQLVESVAPDHKCARLHGHSYRFRIHYRGTFENGMVIDYADIPGKEIEDQLDHRNLNDILGVETTAENLAKWIYDRIEGCHFVEVFETCQVGVRYPAA